MVYIQREMNFQSREKRREIKENFVEECILIYPLKVPYTYFKNAYQS